MRKLKFSLIPALCFTILLLTVSCQCSLVGEAPLIELEIYDGPDYVESEDMVFYRVEAMASGTPEPEITFSEDDQVRLLAKDRVEVAVKAGSSYELTATAANSRGTATVTISLMGEYEKEPALPAAQESTESQAETTLAETEPEVTAEEPEPEEEPEEEPLPEEEAEPVEEGPTEASLEVEVSQSGSIYQVTAARFASSVIAGDTSDNESISGYISFDISSLAGKEVQSASLEMTAMPVIGNVTSFGFLRVGTLDYGTLEVADRNIPASLLVQLPNSTTDINYGEDNLKNALQSKIDAGSNRFQLKLYWSHPSSNGNGEQDTLAYHFDSIHIRVEYI